MKLIRPSLALIAALTAGVALPSFAQEKPPLPRPDDLLDAAAEEVEAEKPDANPESATLERGLAGPYLAARMAITMNDYRVAARYFRQTVAQDPENSYLQDGALISLVSTGDIDGAIELADQILQQGDGTELSRLVNIIDLARQEDWEGLLARLDENAPDGRDVMSGLLRSWALLGAGQASDAMDNFNSLSQSEGVGPMVNYHRALARALVGDYEGALALFPQNPENDNILGLTARVQILAQLEQYEKAAAILDQMPGLDTEPQLVALRDRLQNGEPVAFDAVESPADGIAQMLLTFASALSGGAEPQPLALIHARLASALSPGMAETRLVVAQLLQDRGQFELAEEEFEALRRMGEMRPAAELSRIEALAGVDRQAEAESAALSLTATYPDLPEAWVALGDVLRQQEKFAQAIPAYDKALVLLEDAPKEQRWFPLYARGIALERAGKFERAEKDLLAAIEIRPDQPSLLNYLGYSWIDRNENLERGLDLIRKAVELSPDDGYILDSLAWAYYRLGRYEDAVEPMERAIGTMAADPLVNDHLGDIYWMVGRKREAEIQWKRALSLNPTESGEVDPDRIRAKLEDGLDAVLAKEEGSGMDSHRTRARVGMQADDQSNE